MTLYLSLSLICNSNIFQQENNCVLTVWKSSEATCDSDSFALLSIKYGVMVVICLVWF